MKFVLSIILDSWLNFLRINHILFLYDPIEFITEFFSLLFLKLGKSSSATSIPTWCYGVEYHSLECLTYLHLC